MCKGTMRLLSHYVGAKYLTLHRYTQMYLLNHDWNVAVISFVMHKVSLFET